MGDADLDWFTVAETWITASALVELDEVAVEDARSAEDLLTELVWDAWVARVGYGEA